MSKDCIVRSLLISFLIGILATGSAVSSTLLGETKRLSWDAQNVEALRELFVNKASVETFLKGVKPDLALVETSVGEYEISDLNNDGVIELVVTIDVSGRAIYNTIYVVRNVNNEFQISEIWAPGINILNMKSRIVDIDNDGVKEIMVPRILASPEFGIDPFPIIDDIYKWDKSIYIKANSSFKGYYRSLLPRLKSEREAIIKGRKLDVPSYKALLEQKYEREIEEVNKILNE